MALVVSRARAHPAPLLAVAINVLIVCTLVAGIGASLPLVQRASLQTGLAQIRPADAVVSVVSQYDDEDPDTQDRIITQQLTPVTDVAGGEVVRRLDSGSYDQLASGRTPEPPTWAFTALSGGDAQLRFETGRAPEDSGDGPLEVAIPAGSEITLGEEIALRNRADERIVDAVAVGTWLVEPDSERWFGKIEGNVMLVAPATFGAVDGAGSSARWRAVPALSELNATQLDELSAAVSSATTSGVGRAEAALPGSVRAETTALASALDERARELVVLRALLLVPAALLLLLGGACLFLVAASLADARREEESLLRSRGAGHRQLVSPTVVESGLLCGLAAGVAPLLARLVIRIGDLTPPLTAAAWWASAVAAVVCASALVLPVVLRALTGDRGEQLSAERQRRRHLTALVATVLLVMVLGGLAVLQLRGFGATVTDASSTSATVDPLLVTAPALLLLALAVLVALLVLPLLLQLIARTLGARGVSFALGSRFAARALGRTVPLALVVILASGTLSFAAIQRLSSADSREARAGFEVGADVRAVPPAEALRAGPEAEREFLASQPGVTDTYPVYRDQTFIDDLPAGVLVTPLPETGESDALPPGSLGADERRMLTSRPWRDPALGVAVPDDAVRLDLQLRAERLQLDQVVFLFADPDGNVASLTTRGRGQAAVLDLDGRLAPGSRLIAVRTGTADRFLFVRDRPDRRGSVAAAVLADGEELTTTGRWWKPVGSRVEVVTFGGRPTLPAELPVAMTTDLAAQASLEVGDTFELDVLGVPSTLEVAVTVPLLRTASESDGSGLLLDTGTALPALILAGFTDPPDEWWLRVDDGRTDEVAAAVKRRPDVAETVTTRADVVRRLDDDPSTGGAALGELLVLTSGGGLVVGSLLLLSVVLLRRRELATQDRTLVAVGARRRDLLGVLGTEYLLTTGAAIVAGVVLGAVVARVTLVSMTLGPDGQLLVPAPELTLPGPAFAMPLAAMALGPLLVMVLLTRREHALQRSEPERGGR